MDPSDPTPPESPRTAGGRRAPSRVTGERRPAGRDRDGAAPRRQRRTAGPGPTRATAAAQARLSRRAPAGLTGRALTLGAVVIALILSLASPLQTYLGQRADIAATEQTRRETQASVDALQAMRERLNDPAYIESQARERLQYAMPGDRVFVVVDDDAGSTAGPEVAGTAPAGDSGSWLERLGESVRQADAG